MVRTSELHSFPFCQLAVSPALISLLEARMDPHAAADLAVDAGTKKKSSFQITSVRKGDTASLSSEVGAIDEFDVDADEGEGDGDEDEDNLSGSLTYEQSGDHANALGAAGQTPPDVPQSQSKYRVVRIKKSGQGTSNCNRGRWDCSDYDGNGDQAPSAGDGQSQEDEQSRKNGPRKPSENLEESSAESVVNHEEPPRNGSANGVETQASAPQPASNGVTKKVAFAPTTSMSSSLPPVPEDSQPASNQPAAASFTFLAAVQEAAQKFCASEYQEMQSLRAELSKATQQLKELQLKSVRQLSDIEHLKESYKGVVEEQRCMTDFNHELLQRCGLHES